MAEGPTRQRPGLRTSNASSKYGAYQQKRRADALARQQSARAEKGRVARQLVAAGTGASMPQEPNISSVEAEDLGMSGMHIDEGVEYVAPAHVMEPEGLTGQQLRAHYAKALMQPEWMTDVPPDLGSSWLAMPRPEGQRCLIIASRGWTISRLRTGALLHRFPSHLPEGSADTRAGADSYCILDGIFSPAPAPQAGEAQPQADQTHMQTDAVGCEHGSSAAGCYWILDVLAWRGLDVQGCTAEFRLYWLAAKLQEDGVLGAAVSGGHRFSLASVPVYPATPEGLTAAHQHGRHMQQQQDNGQPADQQPPLFVPDGLYLLHKEGHYSAGSTPLALLWKDAACSRYFVDTDSSGSVGQYQQVTLQYQSDTSVTTADDLPVALGRLPAAFVQQMGTKLRPGRLLHFTIREGGMLFGPDGQPAGADLKYEGPANQRRGRADVYSKVLFQYLARREPLTFQHLLQVAAAGTSNGSSGTSPSSPFMSCSTMLNHGMSGAHPFMSCSTME